MAHEEKERYKGNNAGDGGTAPMYHDMSEDEFLVEIKSEIANELNLPRDKVAQMTISEIEDEFDNEEWGIRKQRDRLGGLLASGDDPYDYPTEKELDKREEEVANYLRKF